MTQNCVVTCEKRISMPVTPETKHRSNIPSFRSINMAPDVKATDRKKMMLEGGKSFSFFFQQVSEKFQTNNLIRREYQEVIII